MSVLAAGTSVESWVLCLSQVLSRVYQIQGQDPYGLLPLPPGGISGVLDRRLPAGCFCTLSSAPVFPLASSKSPLSSSVCNLLSLFLR